MICPSVSRRQQAIGIPSPMHATHACDEAHSDRASDMRTLRPSACRHVCAGGLAGPEACSPTHIARTWCRRQPNHYLHTEIRTRPRCPSAGMQSHEVLVWVCECGVALVPECCSCAEYYRQIQGRQKIFLFWNLLFVCRMSFQRTSGRHTCARRSSQRRAPLKFALGL